MARPGDLLLLLSEDYAGAWEQIGQFKPEMPRAQATSKKPVQMRIRLDDLGGFEWTRNMEIVRDARGVRIARELED
jgi:cyanophycin synthetase